jgi:hypothetical protein
MLKKFPELRQTAVKNDPTNQTNVVTDLRSYRLKRQKAWFAKHDAKLSAFVDTYMSQSLPLK